MKANSGRDFIPFHAPDIGDDEISSIVETLRFGWLTTGPKVKRFEEDFSKYLGCSLPFAANSCTAALHLALDACYRCQRGERGYHSYSDLRRNGSGNSLFQSITKCTIWDTSTT